MIPTNGKSHREERVGIKRRCFRKSIMGSTDVLCGVSDESGNLSPYLIPYMNGILKTRMI